MTAEGRILEDKALDTLFREARTHSAWLDREVTDVLLQAVYDLMKWGPTSANSCPARFIFVKTKAAKEMLKPHLSPGNVEKTMAAPVTAIVGYDLEFYEHLPHLFPQAPARSWFAGKPAAIQETAFRNGSLGGAYLMLAARALGLDCGPMSGFDKAGVTKEFFAGTAAEANFLCNIGYGDPEKLFPRNPRLNFSDACKII